MCEDEDDDRRKEHTIRQYFKFVDSDGKPIETAPGPLIDYDQLQIAARAVTRMVISFCAEPENQAYLTGCFLTAGFFATQRRQLRPVAAILLTMCGGLAARQAYRTTADIRSIAQAAKASGS